MDYKQFKRLYDVSICLAMISHSAPLSPSSHKLVHMFPPLPLRLLLTLISSPLLLSPSSSSPLLLLTPSFPPPASLQAMSLEEGEDPTREHYVPDASGSDANARVSLFLSFRNYTFFHIRLISFSLTAFSSLLSFFPSLRR